MENETMELEERWSVWVGGEEVLGYLVDKKTAEKVATQWSKKGQGEVVVDFYPDEELHGVIVRTKKRLDK